MSNSKKNTFYIQGTILAAASILTRIIGIAFRIPLTRIIGDEGNGAYSNAYEIYNIALLLSTYSIPTAVSKLIRAHETKKEYRNSHNLLKVAFAFSTLVGLIMTIIVMAFATPLSVQLFKSEASAIPLRYLAPTILVFAMMGALRGYFQGKNTVLPTSVSQILEQIIHVAVGLLLADFLVKKTVDQINSAAYGAAGATLGTFAGAIFAFLFLAFLYVIYRPTAIKRAKRDKTGAEASYTELLKLLVLTALPIVMNQFLYSVTGTIDSVIFNNILAEKGVDEITRLKLFGIYSGKFRLLVNVPLAIASAIGVAIIPNVVSAFTKNDEAELKDKVHQAVKFNMMIAIPCTGGLMALAEPIMQVLFKDTSAMSRELMLLGGMSVVFFAYATTTNSILQGINKLIYPVIHAIIGIAVYCVTDIPLLKFTKMGVYALAIGYMVFPFVICVLNWYRIAKELNYKQEILNTFLKPALFTLIFSIAIFFAEKGLYSILKVRVISMFIAIIFAVIIYGVLMIATKALSKEEILELPMGGRIITLLAKLGINL